jgi:glucosamine--fructose-6-phosphate aminotransferase (isomerizing)
LSPFDKPVGALLRSEIYEQPAVLERLAGQLDLFEAVASEARARGTRMVRMVGHGSSDNAASYGVYAFGLLPGWTALRDSISLSVYYGAEVDLADSCVLGLSQSGRTPDVVEYVQRAAGRGAYTIAVTNDPDSPLAAASDAVLPLLAGEERAIAATKTYTAQVGALALLAACAGGQGQRYADGLRETAGLLAALLPELEPAVASVARQLAFIGRMLVVGRGPEFATARELSLKLLETCRVAAEPLTATDLAHGPVAALDSLFPVWAIAGDDPSLPTVIEAVARARGAGATVIASGSASGSIGGALATIPVPATPLPLLEPLLSIAPGQLLARSLAEAKGLDPDRPAGLAKVTLVP